MADPKEKLIAGNADPIAIVDAVFEQDNQDVSRIPVTDLDGLSDEAFAQYFGFELSILSPNGIVSVEQTGPIEKDVHGLYARRYVDAEGKPIAHVLTLTQYGQGMLVQTHLICTSNERLFGIHGYDNPKVNCERSLFGFVRAAMNMAVPDEKEIARQEATALAAYEADPHDRLMYWIAVQRDWNLPPDQSPIDHTGGRPTIDYNKLTDITKEETTAAEEHARGSITRQHSGRWQILDRLNALWTTHTSSSGLYQISPAIFQEAAQAVENGNFA